MSQTGAEGKQRGLRGVTEGAGAYCWAGSRVKSRQLDDFCKSITTSGRMSLKLLFQSRTTCAYQTVHIPYKWRVYSQTVDHLMVSRKLDP